MQVECQYRGYLCYKILDTDVPAGFGIYQDDKPYRGHCICFPKGRRTCATIDPLNPDTYKAGVCPELCNANWTLCCICIEARAEPAPFETHYDGDVWEVACFLYRCQFDSIDDANAGILLNFWAENDYQYSPSEPLFTCPLSRECVIGLVRQVEGAADEADSLCAESFLGRFEA
jgi:hypothetical protein